MTEPWLQGLVDQAEATVRDIREDKPLAHAESRCVAPPTGCGQSIGLLSTAFRDRASRSEYDITGLCQACQDVMFAPPPEVIEEMAADPENYGRCHLCGEYRPFEVIDIGIGVMRGFDCCPMDGAPLPQCAAIGDAGELCWLARDHRHGHAFQESL